VGAGIVNVAFAARQRAAVITVVKDDRIVREPRPIEFREPFTHLPVHECHLVVVVGPVATDLGRVGMIRRQWNALGGTRKIRLLGWWGDLTLVAGGEVEHGEEWLARCAVPVMRRPAAVVPRRRVAGEIVILLRIVRAVISRRAQQLGIQLEPGWQSDPAPVVVRAQRARVQPGDQRGPGGGTDRRIGERAAVPHTFRRQPVEMRRVGERITVTTEIRAVVFAGDPEHVRPSGFRGGGACDQAGEQRGQQAGHP
jgi:hypothetical protein